METLETLKRQIRTAEELHGLVRTMKALAAVNIRQLEHAVESLADYARTVELGLRIVLRQPRPAALVARSAPQGRVGAVVFGSDQGMCGPLNDQIVSFARERLDAAAGAPENRLFLALGERAALRLDDAREPLDGTLPVPSSASGIAAVVQELLLHVEAWHVQGRVARIVVFYSEHTSRAGYRPQMLSLLPLDRGWLETLGRQPWPTNALPTYTMDARALFSALVRQYLFVSLYRACAESLASENASRLAAMRAAERNVEDRIAELHARFHQKRQMTITEELLDIASGFEALKRPEGRTTGRGVE